MRRRSAARAAAASSAGRSSVKSRREKSTVATNWAGTSAASITASCGPGNTTATRSTRSTSSTNGWVGSSTTATVPVVEPSSPVERDEQRRGEERAGRGRVAGLLEEQAQVGGRSGAERGVLRQVAPQWRVRRRVVDVRAHECRRAFALQQLAARLAQEFLIGGQREVHAGLSASGGPARAGR